MGFVYESPHAQVYVETPSVRCVAGMVSTAVYACSVSFATGFVYASPHLQMKVSTPSVRCVAGVVISDV